MANTLKFGNGQWATKDESVLAYNDENNNFKPLPFDFERGSIATRINKEGLIETVGQNEPRIDFKDDSKGALLLEPTRTNLVSNSNDFTSWNNSGSYITVNYGISLDGTQNASRCLFTGAGQTLSKNIGTNGTLSYSIYVKGVKGETINISMASGSDENFTLTGEWQRLSYSNTVTNATINFNTFSSATARDFLIYAAQLEQGSYATSYIPTPDTHLSTRLADTCSQTVPDGVIGQTEGVLYCEVSTFADNTYKRISLNNGSYVNSVLFDFVDDNNLYGKVFVGGSPIATILASGLNIENNNKIAFKYKQNDFALWVNGIEVGVDTTGATPTGLNTLGLDLAGNQDFIGSVKDVKLYDTALTDQELQALTQV